MMTATPENDALDARIEYDTTGASIPGVDDYRPYLVRVRTPHGPRAYRFPDRWQAREFAAITPDPEV